MKLRQHTFSNKFMSLKGVPDSAPSAAKPACKHIGSRFLRINCTKKIINTIIETCLRESNSAQNFIVFLLKLSRKNGQALSWLRVSMRLWPCLWIGKIQSKQPQSTVREHRSSIFLAIEEFPTILDNVKPTFLSLCSSIQLLIALCSESIQALCIK